MELTEKEEMEMDVNFKYLFEEIKNCREKRDLVKTFARYGIQDHTKLTGSTAKINSKGQSTDLYAAFRTEDDIKNCSHIFFQATKIRIDTNESITEEPYFSKYKSRRQNSNGRYKNSCFSIAYDVDEFRYVLSYFLKFKINWLDSRYMNIEPVEKMDFNEKIVSEREKGVEEHTDQIIDIINNDVDKVVYGESKKAFTKIRINQSVFRDLLLNRYSHCCLCGIKNNNLLNASHIKPWAKSDRTEKLDVNNGLLLCPNHDRLFDKGYISFDDNGKILISNKIDKDELSALNISENMKIDLKDENRKYMEYHRKNIFINKDGL